MTLAEVRHTNRKDMISVNGAACSGFHDRLSYTHLQPPAHAPSKPHSHDTKSSPKPAHTSSATTTAPKTTLDLNPELRAHRSSSDAGEHAASRARASAKVATTRSSSSCFLAPPQHPTPQQQQQQQQQRRSCLSSPSPPSPSLSSVGGKHGGAKLLKQSAGHYSSNCIPRCMDAGQGGAQRGHKRSHSHSSIARLAVRDLRASDHDSASTPSRSRRTSSEEEEVTYVWKDGRVQQHHGARGSWGLHPHNISSGQHVEYVWRSGNVQKVVMGPNHEMLSAEVVPPRRQSKGVKYCPVLFILIIFVVSIIVLVVVIQLLH